VSTGRLLVLTALLAAAACKRSDSSSYWSVPGVALELPRRSGWVADPHLARPSAAVALRLERDQALAGSPRVDVVLEPPAGSGATLEAFVERNLREMRALEQSGAIRIDQVEEKPATVGPRRARRVRHDYVLVPADIAITQVSLLLIVDGRGVAITTAGRTELFTPLTAEVDALLAGVRTMAAPASMREVGLEPIDLGRVGAPKP
jgi:hypothetical protein